MSSLLVNICSELRPNKPTEVNSQNRKRDAFVEKETQKSNKRHQMTFPSDIKDGAISSEEKNIEQMLSDSETRKFRNFTTEV